MDEPLTVWYCDICGEPLTADEGYVIWKRDQNGKAYDFKIVHHVKCDPGSRNGYVGSLPLRDFLGDFGRALLLSFLSPGPLIIRNSSTSEYVGIKNFNEFFDLFHRVQTPYYEEARRYFNCPELLEYYADWNEVAPYTPENLKQMIEIFSEICK